MIGVSAHQNEAEFHDALKELVIDSASDEGDIAEVLAKERVDPWPDDVKVELAPRAARFNTQSSLRSVPFTAEIDLDHDVERTFFNNNNRVLVEGNIEYQQVGDNCMLQPTIVLDGEPDFSELENKRAYERELAQDDEASEDEDEDENEDD